jgi:hypothetical protein
MLLSFIILLTESAIGVTNSLDERRTSMTHTQRNDTNSASRPQTHWRKQSHTTFHLPHPAPKPLTRCPQHMPHSISHSVFARTSLTICDSLVMALSYLDDVARGAGGERESVVLGRGDGVVAEVLDEQLKNSEGL